MKNLKTRSHDPADGDPRGAQLLAYLLEELNADERTAIEALMRGDPDLAKECERLRNAVENLRMTVAFPWTETGAAGQLDPERRERVLSVISRRERKAQWRTWIAAGTIAALLAISVMVGGLFIISQGSMQSDIAPHTITLSPDLAPPAPPPLEDPFEGEVVMASKEGFINPLSLREGDSPISDLDLPNTSLDLEIAQFESILSFEATSFGGFDGTDVGGSDESSASLDSELALSEFSIESVPLYDDVSVASASAVSGSAPVLSDSVPDDVFMANVSDLEEPTRYVRTTTTAGDTLAGLPMSIENITKEFIEDIGASDLVDTLGYSSGVFIEKSDDDDAYELKAFEEDEDSSRRPLPSRVPFLASPQLRTEILDFVIPKTEGFNESNRAKHPPLTAGIISSINKDQPKGAEPSPEQEDAPTELRPGRADSTLQEFPEVETAVDPLSTFSLNVSDVSFRLAYNTLARNEIPQPGTLRPEEFVNALDLGDPAPRGSQKVVLNWERAQWPFHHARDLLRLSIRTAAIGRHVTQPLNVVLLIDNSGSMARPDRQAIVRAAIRTLNEQLTSTDRLSVITFGSVPSLLLDGAPGQSKETIESLVLSLNPRGGTHLEDALTLGYATARRNFIPNGINRVVVLTDGVVNLGETLSERLADKVETARTDGIALDCFGIGDGSIDDPFLERLARNGDGRYRFIDSVQSADQELGRNLAGAFRPVAADVKVQVEFNPRRVALHQQLGYAQHKLRHADFRNARVDAAELAPDESGTALYLIRVMPDGVGDLGVVRVRYRDTKTNLYEEHSWTLRYSPRSPTLWEASSSLRLAAAGMGLAFLLNESSIAEGITMPDLRRLTSDLDGHKHETTANGRLLWMLQRTASLIDRP